MLLVVSAGVEPAYLLGAVPGALAWLLLSYETWVWLFGVVFVVGDFDVDEAFGGGVGWCWVSGDEDFGCEGFVGFGLFGVVHGVDGSGG